MKSFQEFWNSLHESHSLKARYREFPMSTLSSAEEAFLAGVRCGTQLEREKWTTALTDLFALLVSLDIRLPSPRNE